MRVLGLDLSLSSTGFAFINDGRLFPYSNTTVPTSKEMPWVDRIKAVLKEIDRQITSYQPDAAYIENYAYNSKFDRETLAELHGVVMYYLTQRGIRYAKIPPKQVKLFGTGQGSTPPVPEGVAKSTWPKRWVVEAVNRRYDTTYTVSENDKVDAFLVALLGYYVELARNTGQIPTDLPDFQQKVIKSILNPKAAKSKGGKKNGKRKDSTQGVCEEQPVKRSRVHRKKL
jgi:Holliday junction resolvasome RuvABC endonuclease subunit